MLGSILPAPVAGVIRSRLREDRLYEIRLRSERPVAVDYGGRYYFLGKNGLTDKPGEAIVTSAAEVGNVVVRASEFSLYAVNDRLARGFITIAGGVRIGVCGEVVYSGGEVRTIKNFTSVNIRVPHEIEGCSAPAREVIADPRVRSALIVGPPGSGKTTVLRDLAASISRGGILNVLLVDERSEIAAAVGGVPRLGVGINTDVISGCMKSYAFTCGIRSMRPDVIITDELVSERDFDAVADAIAGGVAVIASVHASSLDELLGRSGARLLIGKHVISRYVFLSGRRGPGTYENVYDADMKCIRFAS